MPFIPVTINSMPSAINSNPMIRVITLIPVCPSKRTSHGAIRNTPQQQSANSAMATENQANARCCDNASPDDSGANRPAPPLTVALTAQRQCSRVWLSLTFLACFVYLPQLPADHRHCNGDDRDTARNSERINRNTKQLQDAISEE